MLRPGRVRELTQPAGMRANGLARHPEVKPVPPGFIILARWRRLVARAIREAEELTPELRRPTCVRGVKNNLRQSWRHRVHAGNVVASTQ